MKNYLFTILFFALSLPLTSEASQLEADAISNRIKSAHLPYNIIFGVITSEPTNQVVIAYDNVGDSALWTGLYLGAESFRYHATQSPEALANVERALSGVEVLAGAKGDGYLARAIFAVNGLGVDHFKQVEGGYGLHLFTHKSEPYYWQGGVTRDQYSGIYFGLAVAYDYVNDESIRLRVRNVVTKLTDYLIKSKWTLTVNGKTSTTFLQMPQQKLSILRVASHMNPESFQKKYEAMRSREQSLTNLAISVQMKEQHKSYYKFNLEYLYMFNLLRLEPSNNHYKKAYSSLRKATAGHINASFNMYDRVLNGSEGARDAETVSMLAERIKRGFRNQTIDLRGKYEDCGGRACSPVPVRDRAFDGYMWQRSPFFLFYEGDPRIEHAGIDYLLPYWMGRVFNVIAD